ncbi:MAG: ATP-binding cassette domain-containing protein [Christensenellaceae bacterium]|jgi:molybdate transport system ATP-binding protein|nr:ATP-binding cassette domain-containing protein [Christensenellaceae bacterium]
MSLYVDIEKTLGAFHLRAQFESGAQTLALLGASGCGKSMTLKCIAGIETPDAGRIALDGRVLFDSAAHINLSPQRRRVGYLFQQYALFPNMTVFQNIATGAHARHKARRRESVAEKLAMLRLSDIAHLRPHQLSGGQQQRVALARILASEPQAILLDEPFSALDSYLKWQLELELSDALAAFHGVRMWVSHDRDEIFRNCGEICIMEEGKTQPVREKHALFDSPGTVGAARLSGCKNYAAARPASIPRHVTLPEWNLCLETEEDVPPDICQVGIRVHSLRLCEPGAPNAIPCTVARAVEDVLSVILMLRVQGALPGAPLLRFELPKAQWQGDSAAFCIQICPKDILLLG